MRYAIAIILGLFLAPLQAKTEQLSPQQLIVNQMTTEPYQIIDVRTPGEYAQGHIKGAINIPFDAITEHATKLAQLKDKTLVVYCRSGRRAGIFEKALSEQGFKLLHLTGDIQGWQNQSLPLIQQ